MLIVLFQASVSIRLLVVGVSSVSSDLPLLRFTGTEPQLSTFMQIHLVLMCDAAVVREGVVVVAATLHSTRMTLTNG